MTADSCPICLEDMTNPYEVVTLEECEHSFHGECIVKYLRHGSSCPVCRHVPTRLAGSEGQEEDTDDDEDVEEAFHRHYKHVVKLRLQMWDTEILRTALNMYRCNMTGSRHSLIKRLAEQLTSVTDDDQDSGDDQ